MSARIEHLPAKSGRSYKSESGKLLVVIGSHSYAAGFDLHWEGEPGVLRIGCYSSIAHDVKFFLGQEHNIDWATTYPFPVFPSDWKELRELKGHPKTRGDILIGSDVWIGYGALIRSGVKICDGAVVGMGAVVTKDVPAFAIVAGNPAKIVRYRFSPGIINWLLALKWWVLPDEAVRHIAPLLSRKLDDATQVEIEQELLKLAATERKSEST